MNPDRLLRRLLRGETRNVAFADIHNLVQAVGFRLARTRGSHHIYVHRRIPELLNLQEVKGEAKPYQIRQFLRLVERYGLRLEGRK